MLLSKDYNNSDLILLTKKDIFDMLVIKITNIVEIILIYIVFEILFLYCKRF